MGARIAARQFLKGVGLALLFACLAGLGFVAMLPEQPAKPTTAIVTAIIDRPSQYRRVVDVTFRSSDGHIGNATLGATEVNCAVGDVVRAEHVGISLRLAGGSCRKKYGP